VLQFLIFAIPVAIILLYVRVIEKERLWASTGFRRISWSKAVTYALALNFLSFILSAFLFSAGEYLTPKLPDAVKYDPTAVQTAFQNLPRPAYWYMVFTSIAYAGFGEEFIFRGYVLTRLLRKGSLFAVLTSAVMWSSLHLWYLPTLGSTGIWQHLDVILTGLLFGATYVTTKNILPFIIVHAYTDTLLPLSFLYPGGTVDLVAFIVLISGAIAVAGLIIHYVYKRFLQTTRPSGNEGSSLIPAPEPLA
jgi:membrane protease YdiL (CAAX protease family)